MKLEMLPYKNVNLKTNKILEQLTLSSRALAELKGYANTIPNMHILINAVTINEAKDSSAIENIVTTHDDIYKVLTESGYKEENAKEVVDYRNAIWLGYEQSARGAYIIIIGNPDHPEVKGIQGWAKEDVKVVFTAEDAQAVTVEEGKPVCVVAQTTYNYNKFKDLVEIISKKGYDITVLDTIYCAVKRHCGSCM